MPTGDVLVRAADYQVWKLGLLNLSTNRHEHQLVLPMNHNAASPDDQSCGGLTRGTCLQIERTPTWGTNMSVTQTTARRAP